MHHEFMKHHLLAARILPTVLLSAADPVCFYGIEAVP